jgi:extracellular elastinolytic metalloproteinase
MTPEDAMRIAAQQLNLNAQASITQTSGPIGIAQLSKFDAPDLSIDPIPAQLAYVPDGNGGTELAWNLVIQTTDTNHGYNIAVGAERNQIIFANDWVDHASYKVVARPNESPQDGGFSVLTDPQDATASPFGWHDTNGVAGQPIGAAFS